MSSSDLDRGVGCAAGVDCLFSQWIEGDASSPWAIE